MAPTFNWLLENQSIFSSIGYEMKGETFKFCNRGMFDDECNLCDNSVDADSTVEVEPVLVDKIEKQQLLIKQLAETISKYSIEGGANGNDCFTKTNMMRMNDDDQSDYNYCYDQVKDGSVVSCMQMNKFYHQIIEDAYAQSDDTLSPTSTVSHFSWQEEEEEEEVIHEELFINSFGVVDNCNQHGVYLCGADNDEENFSYSCQNLTNITDVDKVTQQDETLITQKNGTSDVSSMSITYFPPLISSSLSETISDVCFDNSDYCYNTKQRFVLFSSSSGHLLRCCSVMFKMLIRVVVMGIFMLAMTFLLIFFIIKYEMVYLGNHPISYYSIKELIKPFVRFTWTNARVPI